MDIEDDEKKSRVQGAKGKTRVKKAKEDEDYQYETDKDSDTDDDLDYDTDDDIGTPKRTMGKKKLVKEDTVKKDEVKETMDETTMPSKGKKKDREEVSSFLMKILTDILPFFKSPQHCYIAIEIIYSRKTKRSLATVWQNQPPFQEWWSLGQPFDGYTLCYTIDTNRKVRNKQKRSGKDDTTAVCDYNFAVFRKEVLKCGELYQFLKDGMTVESCGQTKWSEAAAFSIHLMPAVIKFCSSETFKEDLLLWNRYYDYLDVTHQCVNGSGRPGDYRTCCAIEHLGLAAKFRNLIEEHIADIVRQKNSTLNETVATIASYFEANPSGVELFEGPVICFPGAYRYSNPLEPNTEKKGKNFFTEGKMTDLVKQAQKEAADLKEREQKEIPRIKKELQKRQP